MSAPPAAPVLPEVLWRHPDPDGTNMGKFQAFVNRTRNRQFKDYHELQKYSVTEPTKFWQDLLEFIGIVYEGDPAQVVDEAAPLTDVPDWFPNIRLSYAENCLFARSPNDPSQRTTTNKEDSKIAVTAIREGGTETTHYTWAQLRARVAHISQALRAAGVAKGDRVGAVVSNSYDTLCVWLATTATGAIYSSSSTDMGTKGILDRMLQIEPKWVFIDDWAVYNGKTTDLRPKMTEIVEGMKGIKCFQGVIALPRFEKAADVSKVPRARTLEEFLKGAKSRELVIERIRFRDPFYIAYSSGTTGKPKCLVHCGGGIALNAKKETMLHHGTTPDSRYLQYTTTGWIMYCMASNPLLVGARTILYDGSPFMPTPEAFIKIAGDHNVTHLGLSPRYFSELRSRRLNPRDITNLSSLRHVSSTGMVLSPQLFDWFYGQAYPPHVHLANMTGGTDLAGGIANGVPTLPVYPGECQAAALGIDVGIFSSEGTPLPDGEPGELVLLRSFPTMPISLWGPDGKELYHSSYFARFPGVWTQGDFCLRNPATKGIVMLGRADGVLNPSGVRFGSSEIYSIVESAFPNEFVDSLAVGQRREHDPDESVILFLVMRPGKTLSPRLVDDVKRAIATGLSKRHVPKYVFAAPELPVTVNGKKVELPVKLVVSGTKIEPSATLANRDCLKWFERFVDVETVGAQGVPGRTAKL